MGGACLQCTAARCCRGVKPVEKKDGEGAHNWGNPTENPEDNPVAE